MISNTDLTSGGNILIVDDTPANVRVLSVVLTKAGYRVRVATNGAQALELAQLAVPDLIMLDVMMPDMNGYQVCQQLKVDARTQPVPVIFLSALELVEDKLKAFQVGGADYVTKPFQAVEVLARVKAHLAEYRAKDLLSRANEQLQTQLEEIQALQVQLREQAIRDALTGLFNRRYFQETLTREIAGAVRKEAALSILMLDVDHFKELNDTYGHQVGDQVLQALGSLLRAQTRQMDMACRYGGEEFVVIMPTATLAVAAWRAEELRRSFADTRVLVDNGVVQATLSVGVAGFPAHGGDGDTLLRAADTALYAAKQSGRNCACLAPTEVSK